MEKQKKNPFSDYPIVNSGVEYAREIADGKFPANEYIRKLCTTHVEQLFRDDKDSPYVFHPDRAERICQFMQTLTVDDPTGGTKKMELLPWQCFVIPTFLGWRERGNEHKGKYSELLLQIGRKGGKTTMCAGLCMLELWANETPEVIILAPTVNQAGILLGSAIKMRQKDDGDRFSRLRGSLKTRTLHWKNDSERMGTLASVASREADNLDGYNVSLAVIDESHALTDISVYQRIISSAGARDWARVILPTTSGSQPNSIHRIKRTEGIKALEDDFDKADGYLLPVLYEAEPDDDVYNEDTWHKANPSLRHWRTQQALYERQKSTISTESQMLEFKVKLLNMSGLGSSTSLCNPAEWEALKADKIKHTGQVYVSLDLSMSRDMTAFAIVSREDKSSDFKVTSEMHITKKLKDQLEQSPMKEHIMEWGDDAIVHDESIDMTEISERVVHFMKEYEAQYLILDNSNMANTFFHKASDFPEIIKMEREDRIVRHHKWKGNQTSGIAVLSEIIKNGKGLVHDGNKVATWNMTNAFVSRKTATLLLQKDYVDSINKIDFADALVAAIDFYMLKNSDTLAVQEKKDPVASLKLLQMIQGD